MAAKPPADHVQTSHPTRSGARVRVVSAGVPLSQRFRDLVANRELLSALIRSEIKVKYKNSVLGVAWTMVAPAIQLAIYGVVFGIVFKNGIPDYLIYIASGLLVWSFFSTSLLAGTGVIVGRAGIVKKVSFPREILAIATVGSQSIYLFLQWTVLALFMVVLGHAPDWSALPLVVVGFATVLLWATALSILFSAINVYFRDTQHLMEIFVQIWFWMTPIVYSFQAQVHERVLGTANEWLSWIYLCNPITPVVLAFQRAIYGKVTVNSTSVSGVKINVLPHWPLANFYEILGAVILVGLALMGFAIRVFSRLEGNFAEEL